MAPRNSAFQGRAGRAERVPQRAAEPGAALRRGAAAELRGEPTDHGPPGAPNASGSAGNRASVEDVWHVAMDLKGDPPL